MLRKSLVAVLFTLTLSGCQSTNEAGLFSEVKLSSKFEVNDVVVGGTYILSVNSYDSSDSYQSNLPSSQRCAGLVIDRLGRVGFQRVHSQHLAEYIIGIHCDLTVSDTGSVILSNSRMTVDRNNEAFNHRGRELVWSGTASSAWMKYSRNPELRFASSDDMMGLILDEFNLSHANLGDNRNVDKKLILPHVSKNTALDIDVAKHDEYPFLYYMRRGESDSVDRSSYGGKTLKMWNAIYHNGRRITHSRGDELIWVDSTSYFYHQGDWILVGLSNRCVGDLNDFSVILPRDIEVEFGGEYAVDLYDMGVGKKVELTGIGYDGGLRLDSGAALADILNSGRGLQRDFITLSIPDLHLDIDFRKDGFADAMTVAYSGACI